MVDPPFRARHAARVLSLEEELHETKTSSEAAQQALQTSHQQVRGDVYYPAEIRVVRAAADSEHNNNSPSLAW